jgi:hypothetical protein
MRVAQGEAVQGCPSIDWTNCPGGLLKYDAAVAMTNF